jgi:hypothetical protein
MTNGFSGGRSFADSAKEAVVIIFSILVAFSLDAWWEDRKIESDVRDILIAVQAETETNLARLETSSLYRRQIIDALELTEQQDSTAGVHRQAVIAIEDFKPSSGAMDTLMAAGLLGEVDDSQLRLLLGSFHGVVADLDKTESRAAEYREAARRRIAAIGEKIRLIPFDGGGVNSGGAVLTDTEMLNLLTMRLVEERSALQTAIQLQEHMQKIVDNLDKLL